LKRLGRRGSRLSAGLCVYKWNCLRRRRTLLPGKHPSHAQRPLRLRRHSLNRQHNNQHRRTPNKMQGSRRSHLPHKLHLQPRRHIEGASELSAIKAFKTGRVYAYRETIYQLGYYDTEGYVRDLAAILHPEIYGGHQLRYFARLAG
jgi:hypothetical protein